MSKYEVNIRKLPADQGCMLFVAAAPLAFAILSGATLIFA